MVDNSFERIEKSLESGGSEAGFDFLINKFLEEKKYPQLFEARLMKIRHELGLPLIQAGPLNGLPQEKQKAYDEASVKAAREVGELFLADGDIARAWPYFRAIGEPGPITEAIEKLEPRDDLDAVIEVAYHERVNPRKGFEFALHNYGVCRAITYFGQYPGQEGREESARLLTETVYRELAENIKRTIERKEGEAPETGSVSELVAGRDWLFEGNTYYLDTSHVGSVVQYAIELQDPVTLKMARELCDYGKRLSPMFHYKGNPPFEDVFADHEVYLQALLGEDIEGALAHFRKKVADSNPDEVGTAPAQTLVRLLTRLERYDEAVDVFLAHLKDADPMYLTCPTPQQLCQMSGNYEKLRELAKQDEDLLTYAAATIQS